jgi:hypothetical protein
MPPLNFPYCLISLRNEKGWVLIAKDGKTLGYVAESGIAPLQ